MTTTQILGLGAGRGTNINAAHINATRNQDLNQGNEDRDGNARNVDSSMVQRAQVALRADVDGRAFVSEVVNRVENPEEEMDVLLVDSEENPDVGKVDNRVDEADDDDEYFDGVSNISKRKRKSKYSNSFGPSRKVVRREGISVEEAKKYFNMRSKVEGAATVKWAICNRDGCGAAFRVTHGWNGAVRHAVRHKKTEDDAKQGDGKPKDLLTTMAYELRPQVSKKTRFDLLLWVVTTAQPFTAVDHPLFRSLCEDLNSETRIISSSTIRRDLKRVTDTLRPIIDDRIRNSGAKVSLSADGGQLDNLGAKVFGVIGTYIESAVGNVTVNGAWSRISIVLGLADEFTKSAENIAELLWDCVSQHNLGSHISSLVSDNEANMGAAYRIFQKRIKEEGLPTLGDDRHIGCASHILDLVGDAFMEGLQPPRRNLNSFTKSVEDIYKICKFIMDSPARKRLYKREFPSTRLPLTYVATRWTSRFETLQRAIDIKDQLIRISRKKDFADVAVSAATFKVVEEVMPILRGLARGIKVTESDLITHGDAVLVLNDIWDEIEKRQAAIPTLGISNTQKDDLQRACNAALAKLRKYYSKTDNPLSMASVLVLPMVKATWFKNREIFTAEECDDSIAKARELFDNEYRKKEEIPDSQDETKISDDVSALISKIVGRGTSNSASEFDQYVALPTDNGAKAIPWWGANATYFPRMARMAADLLGILSGSSNVERLFSFTSWATPSERNRLAVSTLSRIAELRSWVLAYGRPWLFEKCHPEEVLDEENDE